MRKRLISAILFYSIGFINILGCYFFWYQNENSAINSFNLLKIKYIERFPTLLRPLFEYNPQPANTIFIIFSSYSSIIFSKKKS